MGLWSWTCQKFPPREDGVIEGRLLDVPLTPHLSPANLLQMPDMTSLETPFWEKFPSSLGGWYIWLLPATKAVVSVCQILPRQLQWVGALGVGGEEAKSIWMEGQGPLSIGWRWEEAEPGEDQHGGQGGIRSLIPGELTSPWLLKKREALEHYLHCSSLSCQTPQLPQSL